MNDLKYVSIIFVVSEERVSRENPSQDVEIDENLYPLSLIT